jgi:hypothetical protein
VTSRLLKNALTIIHSTDTLRQLKKGHQRSPQLFSGGCAPDVNQEFMMDVPGTPDICGEMSQQFQSINQPTN